MKTLAPALINGIYKIDRPKDTIECLEKLIAYMKENSVYNVFVTKGNINPSVTKFFTEEHKAILSLIKTTFKHADVSNRKRIVFYLEYLISETYKMLDKVEIIVKKDISTENASILKEYVVKKLMLSNNVVFIYKDNMDINNIMSIRFKNYTMKFSLLDIVLKNIQTTKDFNFWQLIQGS